MSRPDVFLRVAVGVAMIVGAVTWSVWVATGATGALVLAILAQLLAGLTVGLAAVPERRTIAAALASVVPVIGALAAGWAATARGHGGAELLHDPRTTREHIDGLAIARRLTTSLPSCEALVSADIDARRATIARLAKRATADDIAILRWARSHHDPEVAVEVALAFEDVGERFEQRVRAARAAAAADPSFETHEQLFRVICDGVLAGVVDAPQFAKLATEARAHHEAAIALRPTRALSLVAARARLELAVRRPDVARDLLAHILPTPASPELVALYHEAAYAARRFDLTNMHRAKRTSHAGA